MIIIMKAILPLEVIILILLLLLLLLIIMIIIIILGVLSGLRF